MHRFAVLDPENGWSRARFEIGLYRHHVVDPIVSRGRMRFGFEAGDVGAFTPVHTARWRWPMSSSR